MNKHKAIGATGILLILIGIVIVVIAGIYLYHSYINSSSNITTELSPLPDESLSPSASTSPSSTDQSEQPTPEGNSPVPVD